MPDSSIHDRIDGLKREAVFDGWWWVGLIAVVLIGIGFAIWWWRRRVNREVDEMILMARSLAQGLDPEERELMLEIARLGATTDAGELVPKVRAYNAAIGTFLSRIDRNDTERMERLLERLATIREKLGFAYLGVNRKPPSTRELPVGTTLSFRAEGNGEFLPGIVARSDEMGLSIRFVMADDSDLDQMPPFEAGDSFEGSFANVGRSRGHFVARVEGPPTADGGVPIVHSEITHANASARGSSDRVLIARLTSRGGKTIPVRIREVGLTFVRLASALPDGARAGVLEFKLSKADAKPCRARVATDREADDPLQLRILGKDEPTTMAILAHLRRRVRALATLKGDNAQIVTVTVVEMGDDSFRLESAELGVDRGVLIVKLSGDTSNRQIPVERSPSDAAIFLVRSGEESSASASASA